MIEPLDVPTHNITLLLLHKLLLGSHIASEDIDSSSALILVVLFFGTFVFWSFDEAIIGTSSNVSFKVSLTSNESFLRLTFATNFKSALASKLTLFFRVACESGFIFLFESKRKNKLN